MIYAWILGRLPSEDPKGGYTRDRFLVDLESPLPGEEMRRGRQSASSMDSGVDSLAQFSAI